MSRVIHVEPVIGLSWELERVGLIRKGTRKVRVQRWDGSGEWLGCVKGWDVHYLVDADEEPLLEGPGGEVFVLSDIEGKW